MQGSLLLAKPYADKGQVKLLWNLGISTALQDADKNEVPLQKQLIEI